MSRIQLKVRIKIKSHTYSLIDKENKLIKIKHFWIHITIKRDSYYISIKAGYYIHN